MNDRTAKVWYPLNNVTPDPSLKLIETIYQAALDPQGYDMFMGHWNDWMSARVSALDSLRQSNDAMSDPGVSRHFELALRMIEQLGETPAKRTRSGPQILIDGTATILWQNAEADRLLGGQRRRSMSDLSIPDTHSRALSEMLDAVSTSANVQPIVVQILSKGSDRSVAFRAEPMREKRGGGLVILSSLAPSWPAATDHLLMETHALTVSECAICAQLVQGLPPTEIALRRGTSVATVRTQIKKILRKCQQPTHSELTAYLNSLARLAEDMPRSERRPALPPQCVGTSHDLIVSGRRMIIEEHGPRDGYPVIFLHGMLDGTSVTGVAQKELFKLNLRLICPHRPSFGQSEPTNGPPADALKTFASDLSGLMAHWGVKSPVIIGHMAGALYAYEAAKPCGACGIVNVSGGVPITSSRQFEDMTRRQRVVAFTARYAPQVLPFVVNAGIRQIKNGGAETFMNSLYENAPVDHDLLQDDVTRSLILSGHRFTVTQGHAGFVVDSYHVVRDWTEVFEKSAPLPVRLLHGAHDPVVSPSSVEAFAAKYADRITLDILEDAGQLLFYQSPTYVFKCVRNLIDTTIKI